MRAIRHLAGAVAASVVLVACGQEVASEAADGTPSTPKPQVPTALSCPSNEFVGTAGGYFTEMPDGFDTRQEAVEAWLAHSESPDGRDWKSADYLIAKNGTEAWILRNDGTAQARVDFLVHDGFTVHGYDACTS